VGGVLLEDVVLANGDASNALNYVGKK